MLDTPFRYRSPEDDSARWWDFPFRDGDIVISARSKSGTTWLQMICALLVFQSPDLPEPLPTLSPWLDWLITPREEVYAQLAAQQHRRFIKTHTPLDGLPLDDRATYLVPARHPLDVAVSLYHMLRDNLDWERKRELLDAPELAPPRQTPREWLLSWIDNDADPREQMDSLPGVMWHLTDAWQRRHQPNIVLVHYDDLRADLDGQMRRLADLLDITVPDDIWPSLVAAATFDGMRDRGERIAPTTKGVVKDGRMFFRAGRSGSGRELLTEQEMSRYRERVAELAPPDLLAWLHRDR
ncbi:MAG TPA: sulfotransferase domain-containing protein [Micromonosporaceae bacterium]